MSHSGNDEIIDKERDEMTDPTVDEERKPFCRAIETASLMKELEKYRDGEEIPYDALTKAAMGSCHPGGIKHHFLKSARDILFKEQGIEFKAIPNVGLTRMSDSDKMVKTKKTLPSYNKKVKKDMHRLRSVEYDELTNDEQLCHNVNMSILNVLRCSTAGDGVNKVTKVIANNTQPERLALEETLKMFL
jgi:hypothetical protein